MKVLIDEDIVLYVEFQVIPQKKKRNHTTKCEIFEESILAGKSQMEYFTDRVPTSTGIALCNSKDKYNKAVGKAKALDRAIKGIYSHPEQREIRLLIWEKFFDLLQTNDKAYLKGRFKHAMKPQRIIQKFPKNSDTK